MTSVKDLDSNAMGRPRGGRSRVPGTQGESARAGKRAVASRAATGLQPANRVRRRIRGVRRPAPRVSALPAMASGPALTAQSPQPVPALELVGAAAPVPSAPAVPAAPRSRPPAGSGAYADGDLSLRLYLREISETPLLSIQDEIDLAALIRRGDAAARERMITANLRLVVKIARDYEGMGLPLLDMVNEGNMGLMRAVERFDPTKGAKLSTYAAWWIKQSIKRAVANQGKTIRLPVHLVDRVAKIRRTALKLHEELGREPSDAEVAEVMGMSAARVTELLMASCRPASLDAPVGDDEDTRFADLVRDENSETAFESLDESTRHDMILELLERLDDREISVIRERFGLNGRNEQTLEQIGHRFGVTRERIRQIEAGALRKLRKLVERREAQIDPDLEPFREAA